MQNHSHDLLTQISYLQQCLSNDKKPLALLLGAGCPFSVKTGDEKSPPLIPDMAGITEKVRVELAKCKECGPLLKAVDGHFTTDGRDGTNVEDLLSHIRALRVVVGNDKARGLSADDLDKLDAKICQIIYEIVDKILPDTISPYHLVALWTDATSRTNPVEVFTTNYDILMEQAFEYYRVPYFDGFAGSRKPYFDIRAMEEDEIPPRWARLWKLHGSINWYQGKNKSVFRSGVNETGVRRVIHPSHLKYEESRRMPYLAMMDRLRSFLKKPSAALVILGYSFRDDHINEVLIQGLQGTQTAIAFALLYDDIVKYPKAVKLALERSNLSLLARDKAVISGREANWPEKDAESIFEGDGAWIEWQAADAKDTKNKRIAKSKLGDFAVFGSFIHQLVGQRNARSGSSADGGIDA